MAGKYFIFCLKLFIRWCVILLALICTLGCPFVYGIQCFVCDAAHFNRECNGTENVRQCPITYDTCLTMVRYADEVGKLQITKRCSKKESCLTQSQALEIHAPCDSNRTTEWTCTTCCENDLCNVNAGSPGGRLGAAPDLLAILPAAMAFRRYLWN